ncbi:hypothetical protein THAOC_13530 [Thalassiosira oceanica]|uniref:Uncharacterized protein n=1 Tax=Thalassiosira oceanica TaxID=159749 RepID=K0SHF2_THAOC|nr:hypothetical protein THAOC_13530 [Thalassiosira oceanica]|eukprot:EJK65593.1 hypothetical protein THAOC_13530 [Thalassiosira oceanica]
MHTAQSSITPGFHGMGLGLLQMHAWHTILLPIYCNDYCLLVVLYFGMQWTLDLLHLTDGSHFEQFVILPLVGDDLPGISAFDYCSPFSSAASCYFSAQRGRELLLTLSSTSIWLPAFCFGDLGHALEILDVITDGPYHDSLCFTDGPYHDSLCFRVDGSHAFTMLDSGTSWRYGLIQTNQLELLLTMQAIVTGDCMILCDNFAMKPFMDLMMTRLIRFCENDIEYGMTWTTFLALWFPFAQPTQLAYKALNDIVRSETERSGGATVHCREQQQYWVPTTCLLHRGAAKRRRISTVEPALTILANIDVLGHLATFLEAGELCQVRATCKTLGSSDESAFDSLSMTEEAARRMIESASDEEKA